VTDEMVVFSRMLDLLVWLLPKAARFPRLYRNTLVQRLLDAALDAHEALHDAGHARGQARLRHLRRADAALDKLRVYLRLAHTWRWLSDGQYQHVSAMVAEVGRLIGG
jgi:hypothetical protein